VGVLHYHDIQGSKLALDAVVSGLFGVSSPLFPDVALRRAEKTKFKKYSEGVRSRPDSRFVPFAVTEVGALGGHATGFLNELAKEVVASKGMHVGKLLVSWRRKVSLAVHVAHADNVVRGLSAKVDCGEAASSCVGVPYHATTFSTHAITGRKRSRAPSRSARGAACRLHVLRFLRYCVGVSCLLLYFIC
jgi:hypothetical protein